MLRARFVDRLLKERGVRQRDVCQRDARCKRPRLTRFADAKGVGGQQNADDLPAAVGQQAKARRPA